MKTTEKIIQGKTCLGIELGSTRIKAILTDDSFLPIASGSHEWQNSFENGFWTYSLDDIHTGVQKCFESLNDDVFAKYGVNIETIGAVGVSAMMHGYLAFDQNDKLLVPFRTWRNTTTQKAASELTALLNFNIPERWSIAHLYQAVLDKEPHTREISSITTLAGYIHFKLTGKRVLGVGDASGIFPVKNNTYDEDMLNKTQNLLSEKGFEQKLSDILPKVLSAGENGGVLTKNGAEFLDKNGRLKLGIPFCPPEGDAGTGMTATNAVKAQTGNVSAGTSVFAMLVLENQPQNHCPQIDIVTTPDGSPVAMVHCNNGCSELDMWVNMFGEFAELSGHPIEKTMLYELLYKNAMSASADCGGFTSYNFLSGEPVLDISNGRPMCFRTPDSSGRLGDFIRSQLYSAMAALKVGMNILYQEENVNIKQFTAHGGLFKVNGVAQQLLADCLNAPVAVMKTAGEGGAWGMALLSAYMLYGDSISLSEWLDKEVFADFETNTAEPQTEGVTGFNAFMERYKEGFSLFCDRIS